jgi:hypothetical protein
VPLPPPVHVPQHTLSDKDHISPWNNRNSRLLYIALPIAQNSDLGKRIVMRFNQLKLPDPFKNYDKNIKNNKGLYTPHITLINISIPEDSELDKLLTKDDKYFSVIANIITRLFITCFNINDSTSTPQLHSIKTNYITLGDFIVKVYDDPLFLKNVSEYNNIFITSIINGLLSKIPHMTKVIEHKGIDPGYTPVSKKGVTPTFTHYSINSKPPTESEFAIASWFTDWKPHISLIKREQLPLALTPDNFITQIQKAGNAGTPISFINLWPIDKIKKIPVTGNSEQGSLEYIYISYNKIHKQFFKI